MKNLDCVEVLEFDFLTAQKKLSEARTALAEKIKKTKLTCEQWRALRECSIEPIITSTLAERAGILGPSLSRILNTLEENKLISRKVDDGDNRRTFVSATAKGIKLIKKVID